MCRSFNFLLKVNWCVQLIEYFCYFPQRNWRHWCTTYLNVQSVKLRLIIISEAPMYCSLCGAGKFKIKNKWKRYCKISYSSLAIWLLKTNILHHVFRKQFWRTAFYLCRVSSLLTLIVLHHLQIKVSLCELALAVSIQTEAYWCHSRQGGKQVGGGKLCLMMNSSSWEGYH